MLERISSPTLAAPQPRWRLAETWIGFALGVALYLLISLAMGLLVARAGLTGTPLVGLVVALPQLGLVLPALLIAARRGPLGAQLGLNQLELRGLALVPPALGLGFCASLGWGLVLFAFDQQAQEPVIPLFGDSYAGLASALLAAGIIAPLIEEILFRGFLFGGLRQRVSPTRAAVISALLFAGLHFQPFAFPVLFLYGLLLAAITHLSRSLWPAILMHGALNSFAVLAQFFAMRYGLLPALLG